MGRVLLPWTLWCAPGECILPCFAKFGFVPHAALHISLFYFSAFLAWIARRRGVTWSSEELPTVFHVAWNVPNIVACVPIGLAALNVAWRMLIHGEDSERYGHLDTYNDLEVAECCVWFGTFLAVDIVLVLVHGLAEDRLLYVHHGIFASICYIMFQGCTAPLVGASLIAQELSTPFLNAFTILRGFLGLNSLLTQITFVAFTLTFYALRVGLNGVMTSLYLREVYRSFQGGPGASHLLYSPVERVVLAVVLVGGAALQLYWAWQITVKLVEAIREGADAAGAAADEKNKKPKAE